MAKKAKSLEGMAKAVPTEQEKAKLRKKLHANRPDLGAVNDRRIKKVDTIQPVEGKHIQVVTSTDPTWDQINRKLEQRDKYVTIPDLADKFELDAKKVRKVVRDQGFKARVVERKLQYLWPKGSPELKEVEAALTNFTRKKASNG